ncbi:unnamed protein product [Adineta steineri]|uniref:Uncharacterized protein n=1 Tax=Adineta steineri TaxID=433720 RepID=A0A814U399_9BILA|nr:unnamed protein product [Adineta steineri]
MMSSPSTINLPINIPPASTTTNSSIVPILSSPSSSSIFNGTIDHKKLHEFVSNDRIVPEIKPIQSLITTRKQQRRGSQPPNEHVPQQQHPTRHMAINVTNKILLFSSFDMMKLFQRLPIIFHRQISVLDTIVGKSQALTSLQTRGINLTLSVVTNMGTTTMDVPLKPQEVHDLVNRTGHLITSYVQESLPDDTQQTSAIPTTTNTDNELINTSLNDTIEEPTTPIPLEQTITGKLLSTHRKDPIIRTINPRSLETQQNISTSSKRPILEVHVTAHYERTTFSTTLLSTLKAQYKIAVANIGRMKSRFTAIIHEHALHFLNNNSHDHQQPPTVSSDNHVRIDFPDIRCYGNYSIQQEQENKTKDHLNLSTKINAL